DEVVEALGGNRKDAAVDVGAGVRGAVRVAIEADPDLARVPWRAEHEVDPAGAEIEGESRAAGRGSRPAIALPLAAGGGFARRYLRWGSQRRRVEVVQPRREFGVGEAFGAERAEMGLRRRHPGRGDDPVGVGAPGPNPLAGFRQQFADHVFLLVVVALT